MSAHAKAWYVPEDERSKNWSEKVEGESMVNAFEWQFQKLELCDTEGSFITRRMAYSVLER